MKLSLIIVFTLCTLILTAQNETENNKRISTSWGYNVHLYKGMFDFKPPIVDTSSVYYPESYYYYTSFKHRSDLSFNIDYKISKLFSVSSGAELFLGLTNRSPNMQLINNLTPIESFIRKYKTTIYLNIPLYINFTLNKTVFSAGIIHPISYIGIVNTKTHNGFVTKELFYSPIELLQNYNFNFSFNLTQRELIKIGNLMVGLKIGIVFSTYYYTYSFYNIGLILY
jgi:hypothetical protein